MKDATLQSVFNTGYDAFEKQQPLPAHYRETAHRIMSCRTAALGGHMQSCPDDHYHRIWYNSCKHRMCPQCSHLQIEHWLEKQKSRILKCDHFHMIFTVPHELNPIWRLNTVLMTKLLFNSVRETILELLGDPKHLGAMPGIIATLHTWTKTLTLHPHIHCLVTGGGINGEEWISAKNDFLIWFKIPRDLFRGKLMAALKKAINKTELTLPQEMSTQKFINMLNKLGRKRWNVNIREKYAHGNGVLTYLARYIKGGPIKNSRIVKIDNNKVTFECGREKKEYMTLPTEEFIERYLQHTPPPGSILVRYYGLYHQTKKTAYNRCRRILGQPEFTAPEPKTWQECFKDSDTHPEVCPVCGKRLVRRELIKPVKKKRRPPNSTIARPLIRSSR